MKKIIMVLLICTVAFIIGFVIGNNYMNQQINQTNIEWKK